MVTWSISFIQKISGVVGKLTRAVYPAPIPPGILEIVNEHKNTFCYPGWGQDKPSWMACPHPYNRMNKTG